MASGTPRARTSPPRLINNDKRLVTYIGQVRAAGKQLRWLGSTGAHAPGGGRTALPATAATFRGSWTTIGGRLQSPTLHELMVDFHLLRAGMSAALMEASRFERGRICGSFYAARRCLTRDYLDKRAQGLQEKLRMDHMPFPIAKKALVPKFSFRNPLTSEAMRELVQGLGGKTFKLEELKTGELSKLLARHHIGVKERPLTIESVDLRVASTACCTVLNAWLDSRWSTSVVSRPGVSVQTIFASLQNALQVTGRRWVLMADITGFFDNAPLQLALDLLDNATGYRKDPKLAHHIDQLIGTRGVRLTAAECAQRGLSPEQSHLRQTTDALPQGSPLSMPLANLVGQHVIDSVAQRHGPTLRYVDDILVVVLDRQAAMRAFQAIDRAAKKAGMSLDLGKSRIVDLLTGTVYDCQADTQPLVGEVPVYLGYHLSLTVPHPCRVKLHLKISDVAVWRLLMSVMERVPLIEEGELVDRQRQSEVYFEALFWQVMVVLGWIDFYGCSQWDPRHLECFNEIIAGINLSVPSLHSALRLLQSKFELTEQEVAERAAKALQVNAIHGESLTIKWVVDQWVTVINERILGSQRRHAQAKPFSLGWYADPTDTVLTQTLPGWKAEQLHAKSLPASFMGLISNPKHNVFYPEGQSLIGAADRVTQLRRYEDNGRRYLVREPSRYQHAHVPFDVNHHQAESKGGERHQRAPK